MIREGSDRARFADVFGPEVAARKGKSVRFGNAFDPEIGVSRRTGPGPGSREGRLTTSMNVPVGLMRVVLSALGPMESWSQFVNGAIRALRDLAGRDGESEPETYKAESRAITFSVDRDNLEWANAAVRDGLLRSRTEVVLFSVILEVVRRAGSLPPGGRECPDAPKNRYFGRSGPEKT